MTEKARFEITGVVQGVGFRPFVHRLATELGIDGVVGNDAMQVFVEVVGSRREIAEFESRLCSDAPPLAVVSGVRRLEPTLDIEPGQGFEIVGSRAGDGHGDDGNRDGDNRAERTFVSPDTAVCDDCLRELFDRRDRRFGHPFITCTNCGPRFTITRALPYDRASTTMAGFDMCCACRAEYDDPADRRFHAQPIGCHDCGPQLAWMTADGTPLGGPPIDGARRRLRAGGIVAVKGLGGFHLAVDAADEVAVGVLRLRKHRPDKPFAVMVPDLDTARALAEISEAEAELLSSPAHPIVLCRTRPSAAVAANVAPGNPLLGIMLPYTPVHHLLIRGGSGGGPAQDPPLGPLVMTSGNGSGEPICHRDDQVVDRLGGIADVVLTNDRPIHVPCDDSVVRMTGRGLLPIRRARGYAPMPLAIEIDDRSVQGRAAGPCSVLAVGGELKNAFCISNGTHAWMSQHIGDMENLATLEAFTASVDQFCDLYDLGPDVVAADTHPAYRSSEWARSSHGDRVVEVQHHHAHVVAAMAEHGLAPSTPVLGVAFDGTGDGTDGTIWGGEVLVATAAEFERIAHLRLTPLPGGDSAIRHPWRVALSHLRTAGLAWDASLPPVTAASATERDLLEQLLDRQIGCVPTSSMGRFFDALASLVGIRHAISYEAQAAIEFEIAATSWSGPTPRFSFTLDDPTPLLAGVCESLRLGTPVAAIASACHRAIADGVASGVVAAAGRRGIATVVLTGGVFQNVLLTDLLVDRLEAADLDVRTHRLVPPNDGGLALGQAVIAHHRPVGPTSMAARSAVTPARPTGVG